MWTPTHPGEAAGLEGLRPPADPSSEAGELPACPSAASPWLGSGASPGGGAEGTEVHGLPFILPGVGSQAADPVTGQDIQFH